MKRFVIIASVSASIAAAAVTALPEPPSVRAGPATIIPAAEPSQPPVESATFPIRGELSTVYPNVAALTRDATAIVVGKIVSSAPRTHENVPFTISKFAAEEVVKGTVAAGSIIDVLETGGVMAPQPARGTATQATSAQEYSFEGVPVMKTGERYLLFLRGPRTGPVASGVYVIAGEFQGKHLIDTAGRIAFNGAPQALADVQFATARATNGRSAANVVQEVRDLIR